MVSCTLLKTRWIKSKLNSIFSVYNQNDRAIVVLILSPSSLPKPSPEILGAYRLLE